MLRMWTTNNGGVQSRKRYLKYDQFLTVVYKSITFSSTHHPFNIFLELIAKLNKHAGHEDEQCDSTSSED